MQFSVAVHINQTNEINNKHKRFLFQAKRKT